MVYDFNANEDVYSYRYWHGKYTIPILDRIINVMSNVIVGFDLIEFRIIQH